MPGDVDPAFDFFDVGRAALAQHALALGRRHELQHAHRKRDGVGVGDGLRRAISGSDQQLRMRASEPRNINDELCLILPVSERLSVEVRVVEKIGQIVRIMSEESPTV